MEKEILAPAGSYESLIAAINGNADAVYLGLSTFNARVKAKNFTVENIKDVVKLLHLYGVKCYVTVNTLVKDEEYKDLIEVLKATVEAKVDAYIVQDLGVARIMKECFPSINIHASTQMGINNLNGALFAENFGFSRVVLARETRLDDIKKIKKYTHQEIEYFSHGALCVSYSGNCYLSSFLHNMSGNRGRCLQLCRLNYESSTGERGYLLSAKDLCLLEEMKELMDAGVDSFKIEGRLKHPGYVGLISSIYSSAKNNILENKKIDFGKDIITLKEAFCRDDFLYGAYLKNETPDRVISKIYQNHSGVMVGKVISSTKFKDKDIYEITINSSSLLEKGDGLKFYYDNKEIASMGVGNVTKINENTYKVYSTKRIINGCEVHIILNNKKENEVLSQRRKMPLNINVYAFKGKNLLLEMKVGEICISYTSDFVVQEAKSSPLTKENFINQVSKMGEEPFEVENVSVKENGVFIPKSVLNECRRNALEKLKEALVEKNEENIYSFIDEDAIKKIEEEKVTFDYNKTILVINDIDDVLLLENKDDYLICIYDSYFRENYIKDMVIKLKENGFKNVGIYAPLIMTSSEQEILDRIMEDDSLVLIGNNVSSLKYCLEGKKVIASNNLNVFSKHALKTYKEIGVLNVVGSLEQNKKFFDENDTIYAYNIGYNTLMNFAHCPYKTVNENGCNNCSYDGSLKYENYKIRRNKISLCSFELLSDKLINTYNALKNPHFIDLREIKKPNIIKIINGLNSNNSIKVLDNEYLGLILKETK